MTEEEKKQLYAHPGWETCTFEGAELSTLKLGLETTFREKLEWLEQAEDMVLQMRASREAREGLRYPEPEAVGGNPALNDAPAPPDQESP